MLNSVAKPWGICMDRAHVLTLVFDRILAHLPPEDVLRVATVLRVPKCVVLSAAVRKFGGIDGALMRACEQGRLDICNELCELTDAPYLQRAWGVRHTALLCDLCQLNMQRPLELLLRVVQAPSFALLAAQSVMTLTGGACVHSIVRNISPDHNTPGVCDQCEDDEWRWC